MGLFGFGKKKEWNTALSDENKAKMRVLFNSAVEDGASWDIVYGYSTDIKNSDYILARKTTYSYLSLIVGYRASDMSIALVQTTPELEGCSEATFFKKGEIKKAKASSGVYTIWNKGGMMAGYTQFTVWHSNDEKYLLYVHQAEEFEAFDAFFKEFSK